MSRGNQRDLAREKNLKKKPKTIKKKSSNEHISLSQRKTRDAMALQKKQGTSRSSSSKRGGSTSKKIIKKKTSPK